VRDNAWNFDSHDSTNLGRYKQDAPDGYKDHIEWGETSTNTPYLAMPDCDEDDVSKNVAKLEDMAD